jgi:hypothetical protein
MQSYELIIIGGGSGGVGAGIAASRAGIRTLIVEAQAWLGGTSTAGGVNTWEMGAGGTGIPFEIYCRLKRLPQAVGIYSRGRHFSEQPTGFHWPHELEKVNFPGGENVIDLERHYIDTLRRHPGPGQERGPAFTHEHWHGVPFEPEAFHQTVTEMLEQTGYCDVRLNTRLESVKAGDGVIESLTLSDGSTVAAAFYIDGSGDGVLCRDAGCAQLTGIEPQSLFDEASAPEAGSAAVNAATLVFRVSPVDTDTIEPLPQGVPETIWWQDRPVASCINQYPNGDRNINMLPTMEGAEHLRLGEEAAYTECLRRIHCHWHFMQTHFPEFRRYRLTWIAPMVGVRESYRTLCEKMLTESDIEAGLSGQRDDDLIAIADHAMDRHGANGGCPEVREPYGVPYRCLIPKGMTNLLIACRGAGFSSLAASSCRLSRTMMQLGQAAGNAVALAHGTGCSLPEVSGDALRERLQEQHVQLQFPLTPELRQMLIRDEP